MNEEHRIVLYGTKDIPVLTYSIYYWDYRLLQPVKTLLYVGKAYNFNNDDVVYVYVNDIIKNIPASSGYYDIPALPHGIGFYGLNLMTNLEVSVAETGLTTSPGIYQDKTKHYIPVRDITDHIEWGQVIDVPTTFKTLNKLHSTIYRQLNLVMIGHFDDEKQWGLYYLYTDGTGARLLLGETSFKTVSNHKAALKFTCTENFVYDNNPQPDKTVKELWLQYGDPNTEELQEVKIVQFTNEDCEYDVLSFENRNGSISYLPLKGNTIYSEAIERYMKIDMFDKQEVYASLVDETITVNTGWLTDEQARALEDLYVSKKVYLFDVELGQYLAVNVDENRYTRREFKNEHQLKNYTIKLKLQQKEVL